MKSRITSEKWLRYPWVSSLFIGLIIASTLGILQYIGVLQSLELRSFDRLLLSRPATAIDSRIVMINETEEDIRRYGHPLPDQVFADAIQMLENFGARVIGIDKYRDVPVAPGSDALNNVLHQYNNIVWIFFTGNTQQEFIPAPSALASDPERVGFNDIVLDPDGVIRRGLLFLNINSNNYNAFTLLLALHYLAAENIVARSDVYGSLSLNGISLPKIDSHFGGYSQIDADGYQIILDYPGIQQSFKSFSLTDLLEGKIASEELQGKIVLIGSTAPSLNDYKLLPNENIRYGVEYHAYFISHLLNTAIKKNPPLHSWPDYSEYFWLTAWCLAGALTGLYRGGLQRLLVLTISESLLLLFSDYVLLTLGWWIPLVAPLLGWLIALGLSVMYFSSREHTERRQIMQMFASHVTPEVAARIWDAREQFFSECGVRPDTLTATVLFTDLTNFTTVTENMEPLMLMNWLNQYMDAMSHIVINHGGIVNKYIGDSIMAVFGIPVKRETESAIANDAQQAVRCAISFNDCLRKLNQQWQAQGLPTITMRTGIYTGSLVAGSFGGSLRMEYTVIGDTVNTASRLESFDKTIAPPNTEQPCRILIGDTTYAYVRHLCQSQILGEFHLKGKHRPLTIYQVLGSLGD